MSKKQQRKTIKLRKVKANGDCDCEVAIVVDDLMMLADSVKQCEAVNWTFQYKPSRISAVDINGFPIQSKEQISLLHNRGPACLPVR